MTYRSLEEFRKHYPFKYIDVGARWGVKSKLLEIFPNSKWVGFEPEPDEFSVIKSGKQTGSECLPFALSDKAGIKDLYVTASPDWSSLYEPEAEIFRQFNGLEGFYNVTNRCKVSLKSLDELTPTYAELLGNADYIKVDVQGAAADVLRGGQGLLTSSLIAVEVEVEFLPLYKRQPLFNQVHSIMLDHDFFLFDMAHSRCIRSGFPRGIETKCQIIWGDALYFKDFRSLVAEKRRDKLLALFITAMELGFPDYSLALLEAMLAGGVADQVIKREAHRTLEAFRTRQRRKTRIVDTMAKLPGGRKLLRHLRALIDDNYGRIVSLAHPEYYFRREGRLETKENK